MVTVHNTSNFKGTTSSYFRIGRQDNGCTLYQGNGIPAALLGSDGDEYIQKDNNLNWRKLSGTWVMIGETPHTGQLWVATNGDDTSGDGSFSRPYQTIQRAVNHIITAGDNSTQTYNIEISNGNYPENVILEDTSLYYLNFVGHGVVNINPASGNSFQSTTSNGNLANLHIQNINFREPFALTSANGSTAFTDVILTDCNFVTNGTINLNCVNTFTVRGGYIETAITYNNVNWSWVEGTQVQGNWSFTMDSTTNVPSQGSAGTLLFTGGFFSGTPTFTIGGVATYTLATSGSRFGNAAVTVPLGVTIIAYSSLLRGTWTNNGAMNLRGSFAQGLAGTPPTIVYQPASQIYNDSLVTGTSVADALNTISIAIGNMRKIAMIFG